MKNLYSMTALIVVFGFAGAVLAHTDGQGREGANRVPSYLDTALAKLPKDDADQFRATMKQAHEDNMAIANQIHSLHDDLDTIMSAETFDKDAFEAKSEDLRKVYEKMRANSDNAFANATAQLPRDERKTLVTAMAYPHDKQKMAKTNQ